jgi:hypothetical protein
MNNQENIPNNSTGSTDEEVVEVLNVDAPSAKAPKQKQARNTWPKIDKHEKKNGKQIISHPFLEDDNNMMDTVVVRNLLVETPFMASHGQAVKAWSDAAIIINRELCPKTGELIFFPPITGPMLKTRFDAYMKFVNENNKAVPFNTGGDDEASPGEIQQGIEDMHERYTSWLETKDKNKNNIIASQKSEKKAAEIIRRASLGEKPTEEDLEQTPAYMRGREKKSSSGSSGGSNYMRPSTATAESISSLQDALISRNQATVMKEENKKRRLELYQKRMELEEKRLAANIERDNMRRHH